MTPMIANPGLPTHASSVSAELIAVLVAISDASPLAMTVQQGRELPSGPFEAGHRSLQSGLRAWVERSTGLPLGFLEQLYTFADHERGQGAGSDWRISISYLGLTRAESTSLPGAGWRGWYDYFPWEDRRSGVPSVIAGAIEPGLRRWASEVHSSKSAAIRWTRAAIAFGLDGRRWNEELALQRYELLYEAGLVPEANGPERDRNGFGLPMFADHRRILATGIARLRAKIKYNPVVFELMPPVFTLLQLQRCVEAIAGLNLHKPNFRRLIEQQELVEETDEVVSETGGRPAKAFRFREAVKEERAVAGTKLPITRA